MNLGQLGFCQAGNHATPRAYEYDGAWWCMEHPCPSGPSEGPMPGYCQVGRIHFARDGVYWVPPSTTLPVRPEGFWACPRHFASIVKEVIRRGEYGK